MNTRLKLVFVVLMPLALLFGFLHLFWADETYNFERLHIFLFNLCSGGTILLYYTEGLHGLSKKTTAFLVLAVAFAVVSFLEHYLPAIVIALCLAAIVETIRIRRFSFLPLQFFRGDEAVDRKFHQAALLCLSMGLVFSGLVILNNSYLHWIHLPKLKLDTFFLGFSFPISLITMSLIFSMVRDVKGPLVKALNEFGFWSVNLGVVVFFGFIVFEQLILQLLVTAILFITVIMIFVVFYRFSQKMQQKHFLVSGMGFLLVTAVTGIGYIVLETFPGYYPDRFDWLLRLHSMAALYGWNLCGLTVICRQDDFPIQLHSKSTIALHWFTIIVAASFGDTNPVLAAVAVTGYILILFLVFFSRGKRA